jgi:DNA-directed RNA polymerase subunit M/transcription elongation factor TFIIS
MPDPAGVRQKVADRFARTLDSEQLGKHLEIVLWNDTIRRCQAKQLPVQWDGVYDLTFREMYTQRAIALDLFNLRTNEVLRQRVVSGELPLKTFISMTPYEMDPDRWSDVFERVAYKALRKQLTVDAESAPDGAFTCSKCRSKKTTFYEMQTRSADEPMTLFIQCLSCGSRWKQ